MRYLIKLENNNWDDCDKTYMEIGINSDNNLVLAKNLGIQDVVIVIRSAFNDNYKYYHQVFSDGCLYKLIELDVI